MSLIKQDRERAERLARRDELEKPSILLGSPEYKHDRLVAIQSELAALQGKDGDGS